MDGWTDIYRQADEETDAEMKGQTDKQMGTQRDEQTQGQTDRHTNKAGRQRQIKQQIDTEKQMTEVDGWMDRYI